MGKRKDTQGLVHVGDLIPARLLRGPSAVQARLIEGAAEIRTHAPEDVAYQHTVLCQTGLPYRKTDARTWDTRNGRVFLHITGGGYLDGQTETWRDIPLPFGPKARLVLVHINSEAVRTQSQEIDVEDTLTSFVRKLQGGRDPNGDEIRKYNQQIVSLSSAYIRMAVIDDKASPSALRIPHGDIQISDWHEIWQPKDPRQKALWANKVHLTDSYYKTLIHHAVPLDQRAVAALAHSAMALDIYAWLTQRLCRIPHAHPDRVTWPILHQQFGQNYKQLRQFRAVFIKTLKDVLTQYPDAKMDIDEGGLLLKQSHPPIRKKLIAPGGA